MTYGCTEVATSTTCVVVSKKCWFIVFMVWEKTGLPTSVGCPAMLDEHSTILLICTATKRHFEVIDKL